MYSDMKKIDEVYTKKEVEDLKAWFDNAALPKLLQLDKATFIPNLKDTLDRLFQQAFITHENAKLLGGLHLIERIRAKLEGENTAGEA